MPRNYDRMIRYYDSWFDDLCDPDKGFTGEECWAVLLAIRESQRQLNVDPIDNLPQMVKRGLQLHTLKEQVWRIIEKTESMRARGSKGGRSSAAPPPEPGQGAAPSAPAHTARDRIASARREAERAEADRRYKEQREGRVTYEEYQRLKAQGLA